MSYKIPMGPYHPGLEEPYKLDMICEGETVQDAELNIGFNFRGIEHLAETRNYYPGHRAHGARVRHLLVHSHAHAVPGHGEARRPRSPAARQVHSRRDGGTRAPALARAVGGHRRQAHGLQNHVHDLLCAARESHGRAAGHLRQPRELLHEPRRRRQSRRRRSAGAAPADRRTRARDDAHRDSHLHHQFHGAFALRGHRRAHATKRPSPAPWSDPRPAPRASTRTCAAMRPTRLMRR